ncbi:double-strand siRNA ribonuclease Eri1 [Halteromyces radiatus]|uniref:double-strand siRNA ribonuclease Eri1 n=1 Tax=Halteromyces radiatus TaxID=101107 RepID=UPI00221FE1F4|nr:double-strand siRNA ribonuclease Eri1 [Halteromyces radiatus]KAI8086517.1 double-strand siRNA ribonuclease Eri1 [Halteromyces radiatus]
MIDPIETIETNENTSLTTVEQLRLKLEALGLETKGHKPELKKRLRKALKKIDNKEKNEQSQTKRIDLKKQPCDYYLFFDVEATCEADGGFDYPNEIIEFPVVLVDGQSFEIVDEFRSYVKPSVNPTLSKFCINLTGITQETIDSSPDFIQVLDDFQQFMAKYSLFQDKSASFVTDGPFDIRDFITKQCHHSQLKKRPEYFCQPWINIRKLYQDFYKQKKAKNIPRMLADLNMDFEGHQHSGLDDARNLVYIARKMKLDGCLFKPNIRWHPGKRNRR